AGLNSQNPCFQRARAKILWNKDLASRRATTSANPKIATRAVERQELYFHAAPTLAMGLTLRNTRKGTEAWLSGAGPENGRRNLLRFNDGPDQGGTSWLRPA